MKEIELTPKAEEDLEVIWDYSFRQFGVIQADEYIGRIAAVFEVLATHDIGTRRPELGEDIWSLPVAQHMIYFVPVHSVITIIRILSHSQSFSVILSHSQSFSVILRTQRGMSLEITIFNKIYINQQFCLSCF